MSFNRTLGKWVAAVSLGTDENGKRVRKMAYAGSKAEARTKLRELLDAFEFEASMPTSDDRAMEVRRDVLQIETCARRILVAIDQLASAGPALEHVNGDRVNRHPAIVRFGLELLRALDGYPDTG